MARVLLITLAHVFFLAPIVCGQIDDTSAFEDRAEDAFHEMETGKLTIRFINAKNGDYIKGGKVMIDGKAYKTDYEGRVRFRPPVTNGDVPVVFNKEDFVRSKFDVEIMAGTIFQSRVSISPDLRPESVRIVLDWSKKPRDLDAHLIKEGEYHISYRHKTVSDDGTARLDRDDTNGEGPETITVNQVDYQDTYTFFVHDYSNRNNSNSDQLASESHATVRVYGDDRLKHNFVIDGRRQGVKWTVFKIRDGRITSVDRVN